MPGPYTSFVMAYAFGDVNPYIGVPNHPEPFKFGLLIAGAGIPTIWGADLACGTVGVAYSEQLYAAGGTTPYTWSISSGALPTGTSINSSTGLISGTPTVAGTYNFTVKIVDAVGNINTNSFQIIINAPSTSGNFAFTS